MTREYDDFSNINHKYDIQKKSFDAMSIPQENKRLVHEFIEACRLGVFQKKIGMQRGVRLLASLKILCWMLPEGKIWHDCKKQDIRSLLLQIEERGVGDWEKYSERIALKKFITWLRTEYGYPEGYLDREKLMNMLLIMQVAPEVKIHIERPNKLKSIDEISVR